MTLLAVRNLRVSYPGAGGPVPLVDDVSFDLEDGEVLCLAGESGSGKTLTALSVMRLTELDGLVVEGEILLEGEDLMARSQAEMREVRGAKVAMISQEPAASFNPTLRVGRQIMQTALNHVPGRRPSRADKARAHKDALDLLVQLGVPDPALCLSRYPHQLSGGMLQRASLAMALIGRPALLIADEPTTALDVTIQAQTIELLQRLRDELGMAMLFITHDLGVTAEIADRLAVMYAGRVVEEGNVEEMLLRPGHPYTEGLLASIPGLEGAPGQRLPSIPGMVPLPTQVQAMGGCRFEPRCGYSTDRCRVEDPPLLPIPTAGRSACWHADQVLANDGAGPGTPHSGAGSTKAVIAHGNDARR